MFGLSKREPASHLRTDAGRATLKASLALGFMLSATALTAPTPARAAGETNETDQNQQGRGPIVATTEGRVQGFVVNDVSEFLGIPYAAPPVSTDPSAAPCSPANLRWCPPVAHAPWQDVLTATAYGPICAHFETSGAFAAPVTSIPSLDNSEDCLYLNIFTTNIGQFRPLRPVMVWDYGGGETDGEANDYDGSKLALQGNTVVVTFGYRLNLLGFFAHPAIDAENHLKGNYGLMDYLSALNWVKQNIKNFGGDPNNVTIFGQSAGARNSASMVLSPLAAGLFNRAIFESGAYPSTASLTSAETKGTNLATGVSPPPGCTVSCSFGTLAQQAACLRSIPATMIETCAGNGIHETPPATGGGVTSSGPYLPGVILDGTILPEAPLSAYADGHFNHVPILDGDVHWEGNYSLSQTEYYEEPRAPLTEAQFEASMTSTYGATTAAMIEAQYPLSDYPSVQFQWSAVVTSTSYTCDTEYADQLLAKWVPLYVYEFKDQTAPQYFPPMPGFAFVNGHTSDIQYYWMLYHGGNGTPHPLNPQQETLSDQLVAAWTNFAHTSNPNRYGYNPWPQFTQSNRVIFTENLRNPPPFVASTYSPPLVLPPTTPPGLSTETDAFWVSEFKCSFWDPILGLTPVE
jgi:para-nitrobenzyl esterase